MRAKTKFVILLILFPVFLLAEAKLCRELFKPNANLNTLAKPANKQLAPQHPHEQPIVNKEKYFKDIAWLLQAHHVEIRKELSAINNGLGTNIEITQAKAFLRDVHALEGAQIKSIMPIENAVIYGSTNVPLYTLISQVFLTATFAKNVWVRTPTATREIYVRLFKLFSDYLPAHYTQHIKLITDPSDLAYDQFNRIYVMGQNRAGTKSLRPPSELVILTGNPDTAKVMIDRNIRNIQKTIDTYPNQKQLFLGFLAGVNPAIVLPSAQKTIKSVVDKLVFPFLVNGGQDCMNSDVVFVHSDIASTLKNELLARFSKIKLTQNTDHEVGISPLTMTKSFDRLIEYRNKYKKYLQNPEAIIDESTKQVSPHLFVFPYSVFKTLDIQEHFAPFMTIVKFENPEQLEEASLDPRLQRKAMVALVYGGDRMSQDIIMAKDIFQRSQHTVLLNTDLYAEFEMSLPFGGSGSDTSLSVLIQAQSGQPVTVQKRHRPFVISREVNTAFTKIDSPTHGLVAEKTTVKDEQFYKSSLEKKESRSLKSLKQTAQANGLYLVIDDRYLDAKMSRDLKKLYGTEITKKTGRRKNLEGVVLHLTDVGVVEKNDNLIMGERNPLLGDESLNKKLGQDKLAQFELIQSINPELMPGTSKLVDQLDQKQNQKIKQLQSELIKVLETQIDPTQTGSLEQIVFQKSYELITEIMQLMRIKFPRGAYFKNYGEYATGDLGNAITTFSSSPLQIAKEFSLWAIQVKLNHRAQNYSYKKIQDIVQNAPFLHQAKFINALLFSMDKLIMQEKIDIAQTHMGQPMEFRVDFIYGQAVSARMRFGPEYYPHLMAQAMAVLNETIKNAPGDINTLSGGADLALTKDGKWVLFEFNFGGSSGTLRPEYFPFEANRIFSFLKGEKTFLLSQLDLIMSLPTIQQREFILAQKNEKPIWWKESIEQISQIEWAKEIRDAKLKKWLSKGSKPSEVAALKQDIAQLLDGLGTNGNVDFIRLKEATDLFINDELSRSKD